MKKALAIGGGGSKGAFALGAIRFFRENLVPEFMDFKIVSGTSTGSLIAPLVITKDFDLLERIYTTVRTADIIQGGNLVARFMNDTFLYSTKPLHGLIVEHLTPARFTAINNSGVALYNTSTCLQTGKIVSYTNNVNMAGKNTADLETRMMNNLDELILSTLASCNQPVFMPPIRIDQNSDLQYGDGGVRETLPIEITFMDGATEVWILDNNTITPDIDNFKYTDLLSILKRAIHLFQKDVAINDVLISRLKSDAVKFQERLRTDLIAKGISAAEVAALFDQADNPVRGVAATQIHHIHPDHRLAADGGLEFDPVAMREMMDHGFDRAKKYILDNGLNHLIRPGVPV